MGIVTKLILGATAIGLVALISKGKQAINQFTFKIVGYDTPTISKWILSVPLVIEFNNPLPAAIPLQRFEVDIFMLQKSVWQQIARIDQALVIDPGVSRKTIEPKVDLKAFFANNFLFTLDSLLKSQSVKIRTDITVTTPGGITLPVQSQTFDLMVPLDAAA